MKAFLNLISKEDKGSCYPFANEEYRNIFRHTLWMLPGVKEARAMSALLQSHPVFQHFKVVNVAGDGDEDEESKDALAAVEEAIGKDPDATRTITLSCGRLTTGVSVKAWTGVFMLSGSYNTAASSYMQTIFRVQTPATINGRVKEQCYVFDFAPARTLKVIAETAKISSKAGKTSGNDRKIMGEFLNFCPIISIEGSKMSQFDVPKMLEQLKRVYVERVVRNGFEDKSLYNDELMKLNDLELQEFDDLKKIIGQTKAMPKTNQVDINNQGLTDEQYEELEYLEKKSRKRGKDKQPLTEEEKKRLEELKKKKNNREAAISILRGISIRMPLLIYGAELQDESQEITIDNFASLIDPQSVVYRPLQRIFHIGAEAITAAGDAMTALGISFTQVTRDTNIIAQVLAGESTVTSVFTADQLNTITEFGQHMDFFGIDLTRVPQYSLAADNLPLLIFPILAVVTMFISTHISMKASGQEMQGSMKLTMYMMPLMYVFFCFTVPCAFSLYYVISNIVMTVQTQVMRKIYDPEKMKEQVKAEIASRRKEEKRGVKSTTIKVKDEKTGEVVEKNISASEMNKRRLEYARQQDAERYKDERTVPLSELQNKKED